MFRSRAHAQPKLTPGYTQAKVMYPADFPSLIVKFGKNAQEWRYIDITTRVSASAGHIIYMKPA